MDQSIDAFFPDESQDIRTTLDKKNREMKKQLEKRREKKWDKFTGRPDYGYYTPKNLKSRSPKQLIVNSTQLHRNVTFHKKKKRSYAEIVKLNNPKRGEDNKESLDPRYEKNGSYYYSSSTKEKY